jgi:hypothetical protein
LVDIFDVDSKKLAAGMSIQGRQHVFAQVAVSTRKQR